MDYLSLGFFKPVSNGFFVPFMRGFLPLRNAIPCPLKCLCNSSGDENALRHTLQTFCRERNGFESFSSITSLPSSSSSSAFLSLSGWDACPKSVIDFAFFLGLTVGSWELPRLEGLLPLDSNGALKNICIYSEFNGFE